MKSYFLSFIVLASSLAAHCADVEITSLARNGQLTWTNSFTNGLFTVQWAPTLSSNWNENWAGLKNFATTGQVTSVEVPMFYRVKCLTNLFVPTPYGGQSVFALTMAGGGTSTVQTAFLGGLNLASGKEYTILEMTMPTEIKLMACRSTSAEFYTIPFESKDEVIDWRSGPSGTTWTNYYGDGSSDQATILGNEVVTVPAGTFDCIKIEKREINNQLRLRWLEWIKPGFGMVKQFDIRNDQTNIMSLISWTDSAAR